MTARPFVGIAVLAVLVGGCGGDRATPSGTTAPSETPLYTGTGAVIDWPSVGPRLCFSVMESDPPQCGGGVELAGWNWSEVDGERSRNGVTYLDNVTLVGTFDGEVLTVTEPPQAPEPPGADTDELLGTQCPEPPGGWQVVDPAPAKNDSAAIDAVQQYAWGQSDFADVWLHDGVVNAGFTSDLDRHEQEIRTIWGGKLCVFKVEHSRAELEAIGEQIGFGPNVIGWLARPQEGHLHVLAIADIGFQEELDERFGPGLTYVEAMLTPVE